MPTIAEENTKILRRSLDVIVGMDIPFVETDTVTASGEYSGASGQVNGNVQRPILMDLSNGGFLNDGNAIPLGDDTDGFVSQIGTNLVLTATALWSNTNDVIVIGYIGDVLHKWTFSGSGKTRTITIPANTERIVVNRVVFGEAFWFDNASLISCNLSLRSVETKVDNPELQMSEIEFEGYEPNDITDVIGKIGTGYPIYYTSGYPGDMSPVRKFYLGEAVDFETNTVTIKGYDATYLLDEEYEGKCIDAENNPNTGGLIGYTNEISKMLTAAGINHSFIQSSEYEGNDYTSGNVFIDKQAKRDVIASSVNQLKTTSGDNPYVVNYVDAGIPKLWTGKDTSNAKTLGHISKPKVLVDPATKALSINVYRIGIALSSTIETVDVNGAGIFDTSEPYYSFSANSGTISYLGPYSYKLEGSGSITVSGTHIYKPVNRDGNNNYLLPLTESTGSLGNDVDLGDTMLGGLGSVSGNRAREVFYSNILQNMLQRSNICYQFDFRGDPKLQPRAYIRADIDGSGTLVDMTIDTIDIKHEGGGTSSTILARKGFI